VWWDLLLAGHPVVLCTDDSGVFNTTLSKEYSIAAHAFHLDQVPPLPSPHTNTYTSATLPTHPRPLGIEGIYPGVLGALLCVMNCSVRVPWIGEGGPVAFRLV
jgi:hypothetical protein